MGTLLVHEEKKEMNHLFLGRHRAILSAGPQPISNQAHGARSLVEGEQEPLVHRGVWVGIGHDPTMKHAGDDGEREGN